MKILKKSIGVFILCFVFQNAIGQSGFLGSTYNVELEVNSRVMLFDMMFKNRSKLKFSSSTLVLKRKTRVIQTSYNLGVSKVLNDNYQVGVQFGINSLPLYIPTLYFKDTTLGSNQQQYSKSALSTFNTRATSFSINVKKYSKGISPIGKYFGFILGGVIAKADSNQLISVGYVGNSTVKFLSSTASVFSNEEINFSKGGQIKNMFFNFTMGETIPVNRKLGINIELSFPLLRLYVFENGNKTIGLGMENPKDAYDFGTKDLSSNLAYALKKSQGIRFNVGIKYFL